MSDDVKLVITSTFGIVILAWVVLNASNVNSITQGSAAAYSTAVKSILPANG